LISILPIKNLLRPTIVKIFLFSLIPLSGIKAQVRLLFEQSGEGPLPLNSLTSVIINNSSGKELNNATLQIKVSGSEHQELIRLVSKPFSFQPGISHFDQEVEKDCRDLNFCRKVDSLSGLPSGTYSIVFLLSSAEGIPLSQEEVRHIVTIPLQIKNISPVSLSHLVDSSIIFHWSVNGSDSIKKKITYHLTIQKESGHFYSVKQLFSKGKKLLEINLKEDRYSWKPDSTIGKDTSFEWKVQVYKDKMKLGESPSYVFYYSRFAKKESLRDSLKQRLKEELKLLSSIESNSSKRSNQGLPNLSTRKGQSTLVKKVQVHGTIEAGGQYNDAGQIYLSSYPPLYGYVRANPDVKIGVVPFMSRIYYSSIPGMDNKNISNFSFGFNALEFRNNMRQKLLQKSGLAPVEGFNFPSPDQLKKQIEKLDEKLKDTSHLQKRGITTPRLKASCDSLLIKLNKDSSLRAVAKNFNKLKDSLYNIRSKEKVEKVETENMMNKLHDLQGQRQQLQKYKDFEALKEERAELLELLKKAEDMEKEKQRLSPERLKNDELMKNELDKKGILKGPSKYLMDVDKANVGTVFPEISPYVISGASVKGADIEFSPGIFFLGLSAGINDKTGYSFGSAPLQKKQTLTVGQIGLGSNYESFIHLILLHAKETGDNFLAKDNVIGGIKARFLGTERLLIEGEYYRSSTSNNGSKINLMEPLNSESNNPFITKGECMSANVKYLPSSNTIIKTKVYKIGPGYETIMMPGTSNDAVGMLTNLSQKLLNGKLLFDGSYKREHDNLISWKSGRTVIMTYSAMLS
jgi:hypothetical protein